MSKQVTLMTDAIPYQEFAKLIGKSTGAVRRMIDKGKLPVIDMNDVHEAVTAVAEHVQEKLSATEQRLAEMETAFSALKQEVTDRADETSQAFTRLKNSLDHTESLTQQRRSKATGGGGDALMTNC
ncbi:TPA: hypothetical protein IGM77_003760 [Escherichia coli]|nr:hypothetical protein [Escherichia coli]